MKKVIFGKVIKVKDFRNGCKCNYDRPQFYINDKDYMYDITNTYSVRYLSFPFMYDEIKDIEFDEYDDMSNEHKALENFCSKANLTNYYASTESIYFHTCYSEWTCGLPGEREVVRLGELENLEGKYVIFFLN